MDASANSSFYSIVAARPRDLALLPAVELAAARLLVGHAPESVLATATSAADFERASRDGHLWVALADDSPVGFAHVKMLEPEVAHLEELDVHPDHGRRGLGTGLVNAVCDWARGERFTSVTLSTFRRVPWNMPFYEKLGFAVVPRESLSPALAWLVDRERRRGLDTDARVVMRRILSSAEAPRFSVRLARPQDRPRMLEVWERSVRVTHRFLSAADVASLTPLVRLELESDAIGWWVLDSGEAIVGLLGLTRDTIDGLFIDPDYRGRGGGKLLVEHAQRLAAGPLAVDVNEQNDAAKVFYERLGFAVVGRSPRDSGGRAFPILHMKRLS